MKVLDAADQCCNSVNHQTTEESWITTSIGQYLSRIFRRSYEEDTFAKFELKFILS
ncbi:hypothetical protein H6777_03195 [Candidatus Nomurabacteria bacterium]|nr:hypothetical protein [Candidatus Nomurabacteria bacterium]